MKIKRKREAILLHLKLKGCNYLEKTVRKKKKGEFYQQWGLWHWCSEFLPRERWRGRWETHAACRENAQESQNSPLPPALAHPLGTFGSLIRSLDEEEAKSIYSKDQGKDVCKKNKTNKKKTLITAQRRRNLPPILSMMDPSTSPAQVSNTNTLLPAWMFARVSIWASVSYRRWLRHMEIFVSCRHLTAI